MSKTLSKNGVKKVLEERLESINFQMEQSAGTDAEIELREVKQEILRELEAIETEELIVDGVLPAAGSSETDAMNEFLGDVFDEMLSATDKYGGFNSAHEAYGVILEELEEFWDEVKKKRKLRNTENMRKELVQTAAMCMKAAISLGL